MILADRFAQAAKSLGWLWLAVCWPAAVCGQPLALFPSQFELSGSVHLDEVDSTVRAHLERAKAYVADQQWDEAVETLRQVMENSAGKVIHLTGRRYVSLADYCQLQIASLPAPALALYRQRVDPQAEKWYAEAVAQRDPALLSAVVDQMFCSSVGDKALLALGELALEQGRPSIARGYWERIVERPPERVPAVAFDAALERAGADPAELAAVAHWYHLDQSGEPAVYRLRHEEQLDDPTARQLVQFWQAAGLPPLRLAYPGTSLDLAGVRARLVLASIMEGALDRARSELEALRQAHPEAVGYLAGVQEPYVTALGRMLTDAESWPARAVSEDWPTFAGNPARNKVARQTVEIGAEIWPAILLGDSLVADVTNTHKFSSHRVGERSDGLLSYHPVVSGNLLLVCNGLQVFAFDLRTGKPAWPGDPKKRPGEIYSEEIVGVPLGRSMRGLGVPRFTLTVAEGKLYARLGSQVTTRPVESYEVHTGSLVALDLNAAGTAALEDCPRRREMGLRRGPDRRGDRRLRRHAERRRPAPSSRRLLRRRDRPPSLADDGLFGRDAGRRSE